MSTTSCTQGLIHWNDGNVFVDSEVPTWAPNLKAFSPPYFYTLESGKTVRKSIMRYAGVGKGPFAPKNLHSSPHVA